MQRFPAAAIVAIVSAAAVTALAGLGCTSDVRYQAMLRQNQEQAQMIRARDQQLALNERQIQTLQVEKTAAEQSLADRDRQVATVQAQLDAYKQAYEDATANIRNLATQPPPNPGSGGGLSEALSIEIEQILHNHPGLVQFDRAAGRLRLASDITFASGSNTVQPDAQAAIRQLAGILGGAAGRDLSVTIIGHTDSDPVKKPTTIALLRGLGKDPTNVGLSEARAESVAAILVAGGLDAARIRTEGKGAGEPVGDAKAQNRRVEIFLK